MCLAFLRDTDGEYILIGTQILFPLITRKANSIFLNRKRVFIYLFIYYVFYSFRLYCKHAEMNFDSPELELKYFLNKTKTSWKWKGRTAVPPEHAIHCK